MSCIPTSTCSTFEQAEGLILATHLGDNRTLVLPVAHTIYYEMGPELRAKMGIADNLLRCRWALKDVDDLINDFCRPWQSGTIAVARNIA